MRFTDWREYRINLGTVSAGNHTLTVGGYNNRKTTTPEVTEIRIDDVRIDTPIPDPPNLSVQASVDALDFTRYQDNVATLAAFGTCHWSQQGNIDAGNWIESELISYGYTVERHTYTFQSELRDNIYATKVGSVHPDRMYIVSAHMDSINFDSSDQSFAPGADDDASGTSVVVEAARVFAPSTVDTETSIRFILWNNEETGLDGSEAYVDDRRSLQGIESPVGSGQYPEPTWLGIYQHDMMMFDHGLPPQATQINGADVDIGYQSGGGFVGGAIDLATAAWEGNVRYATDYPAEVSADMNNTDSRSVWDDCPAVSLRENRRLAEIGNGGNPHWHRDTDVVATYSVDDFRLGFNAAQTTVGAVARLAGASINICGDGIVGSAEGCDDLGVAPGDGCDALCEIEPDFFCGGEPSSCDRCLPTSVGFPLPSDTETLTWQLAPASPCPDRVDIARGEINALRAAGVFGSAICLENDLAGQQTTDSAIPDSNDGFWYMARSVGGSWDDPDDAGAAVVRDSTLTICP